MELTAKKLSYTFVTLAAIGYALSATTAWAATTNSAFAPSLTVNMSSGSEVSSTEVYSALKLSFLISALTFLPSIIMAMTSFTRISIILSMTRQALGLQHTPPNQVLLGLAVFLTLAVMGPVFEKVYTDAVVPYSEDQMGTEEAMAKAFAPLRQFMLRHTREQDLALFVEVTHTELPESPDALGAKIVVPAFILSELNSAFQISFLIYIPFLVLDMIVSSVLTSMSMITLPPTVVSLPIKLMLFVFIDGWHLIIENVVKSYHV